MAFYFLISSCSWSQKAPNPDSRGAISANHVYTNPALGITITLPGAWRLTETTTQTPNDPTCTGPLCGPPDVNEVLESKPGSNPSYKLYLSAWKLSLQYLDRNRYPLRWFAGIMLEGSMGNNLVTLERQTPVQFDGKPAFRVMAAGRGETTPRVLGYVSEDRGYVFLLVGGAPSTPDPLKSAIEAMKLR